jgi:phosphotransferase system enzyme I (PtsI)
MQKIYTFYMEITIYKIAEEVYNQENQKIVISGKAVRNMQVLEAAAIGEQIAVGRLHMYRRVPCHIVKESELDWEQEDRRFIWARNHAIRELADLYERAGGELGEEEAYIFAIHSMLLEDEDLNRRVHRLIREEGVTAQYAIRTVGREVMRTFEEMDSPYMRARAADIQDITRRMILRLLHIHPERTVSREPVILASDYFLPSEVMELDRRRILGLVTTGGSVDSHTAQILRYCRIPTLVGLDLPDSWEGRTVLMDGHTGRLYLEPDVQLTERLRREYERNGYPGAVSTP